MNSVIIKSANDIDLNKHGVIEAHAGTGKTYTIVNLVLRMLEQFAGANANRFIHLRDIMLVTYTDKAAGELKKRIQDGIAPRITALRASAENDALAAHLENCLNNMHEAFIGTIHSVCLRLLQTWPFETGVYFNTQIVQDDENGLELILRESMRSDWQDDDTQIPQALKILDEQKISLVNNHFKLIRQTAQKFLGQSQDDCGNIILDNTLQDEPIYNFIIHAARALAKRYRAYKKQNGLISYDDMLQLTQNALYNEGSVLLKTLRQRLRYGIIDEFQDTSPTQWSIFKKIFLDNDSAENINTPLSNAVYIVGDPKQSIYSFQNADIRSYIKAKNTISNSGGTIYSLVENYRSLPNMIYGYNAILRQDNNSNSGDWFAFSGDDGISYPQILEARPPSREEPRYPLQHKAVQVIAMNAADKTDEMRLNYATAVSTAIKKLRGANLSIPKGLEYEEITLDYKDFAVIVETNDSSKPFIDVFQEEGIPCMKYKLPGVFKSALARDLTAFLTAITKRYSRSHTTLLLLTHFFNKTPQSVNPASDLLPCENIFCGGDSQCVAHMLIHLEKLATRQLWGQLFEAILNKTNVRQRLLQLADGERKLADLRQVIDYCVEYLYGQNADLEELIAHLERLANEEESAKNNANLHTLATEKSSVTILTMHASKGLEFPVVFLLPRNSIGLPKSPNVLSWTDKNDNLNFCPYLSMDQKKSIEYKRLEEKVKLAKVDIHREQQRLHYVAITRPQAMLFVPMLQTEKKSSKENVLSKRLKELLDNNNGFVELFDIEKFDNVKNNASAKQQKSPANITLPARLDDIPKLSLEKFIVHETSYTAMSKILKEREKKNVGVNVENVTLHYNASDSDILPVNELHVFDIDTASDETNALPSGRLTGIALHAIIETILNADDISALLDNTAELDSTIEKHLRQNGILNCPTSQNQTAIIETARAMIHRALTLPYSADFKSERESENIIIKTLAKTDRISEAAFLFSLAPHRISGSMDLLFRVKNSSHSAHPYRYHFIDWKSDTVKNYDEQTLAAHCRECNYGLQSKIYAHALDKYLRGILGKNYSQKENLGASIYVFLRGENAYVCESLAGLLDEPCDRDFVESVFG